MMWTFKNICFRTMYHYERLLSVSKNNNMHENSSTKGNLSQIRYGV